MGCCDSNKPSVPTPASTCCSTAKPEVAKTSCCSTVKPGDVTTNSYVPDAPEAKTGCCSGH